MRKGSGRLGLLLTLSFQDVLLPECNVWGTNRGLDTPAACRLAFKQYCWSSSSQAESWTHVLINQLQMHSSLQTKSRVQHGLAEASGRPGWEQTSSAMWKQRRLRGSQKVTWRPRWPSILGGGWGRWWSHWRSSCPHWTAWSSRRARSQEQWIPGKPLLLCPASPTGIWRCPWDRSDFATQQLRFKETCDLIHRVLKVVAHQGAAKHACAVEDNSAECTCHPPCLPMSHSKQPQSQAAWGFGW